MVRFAVLGCGRIGRMHAGSIAAHPRAKLTPVYDVCADAALASLRTRRAVRLDR
jgi:myo-inositol 2-dehydrogenase/D-chiro-inositol 1-dehydrogenase